MAEEITLYNVGIKLKGSTREDVMHRNYRWLIAIWLVIGIAGCQSQGVPVEDIVRDLPGHVNTTQSIKGFVGNLEEQPPRSDLRWKYELQGSKGTRVLVKSDRVPPAANQAHVVTGAVRSEAGEIWIEETGGPINPMLAGAVVLGLLAVGLVVLLIRGNGPKHGVTERPAPHEARRDPIGDQASKKCPQCRAANVPSHDFCVQCGEALTPDVSPVWAGNGAVVVVGGAAGGNNRPTGSQAAPKGDHDDGGTIIDHKLAELIGVQGWNGNAVIVTNRGMIMGRSDGTPERADPTSVPKLPLEGSNVSRQHAHLEMKNPPTLTDMASKNGTYVNGERITEPRQLENGDHIKVGDYVFRFSSLENRVARSDTI